MSHTSETRRPRKYQAVVRLMAFACRMYPPVGFTIILKPCNAILEKRTNAAEGWKEVSTGFVDEQGGRESIVGIDVPASLHAAELVRLEACEAHGTRAVIANKDMQMLMKVRVCSKASSQVWDNDILMHAYT
jgi:hypothetical protein